MRPTATTNFCELSAVLALALSHEQNRHGPCPHWDLQSRGRERHRVFNYGHLGRERPGSRDKASEQEALQLRWSGGTSPVAAGWRTQPEAGGGADVHTGGARACSARGCPQERACHTRLSTAAPRDGLGPAPHSFSGSLLQGLSVLLTAQLQDLRASLRLPNPSVEIVMVQSARGWRGSKSICLHTPNVIAPLENSVPMSLDKYRYELHGKRINVAASQKSKHCFSSSETVWIS